MSVTFENIRDVHTVYNLRTNFQELMKDLHELFFNLVSTYL